jgi:hypothetical protein
VRVFTPFVSDDQVIAIGRGLRERTLPKAEWTHAAHFAAALWLLSSRNEEDASHALPPMIRAYNATTGVANTETTGYHETITQASIRAARWFIAANPGSRLFVCCNDLMKSPFGDPDWLLDYWSRARLFSVDARRTWVDPDVRPLPF